MGKLQHYVPRFYLRAWTNDEKIYCLQDGQVRHQNIKGVGAENYFYRLHELTPEDVRFLKEFINDSPDGLRESHERLLNHFLFPHLAKHQLETAGRANAGLLEEINRAIVEMNERMHTSIEEDFKPQLDALISGDLRFLADPAEAAQFYWGLAIQYSRTNHIKKMHHIVKPERLKMYLRIANPLVHIMATNVGLSLFAERARHEILLLDNATGVHFVTADQPVINIATGPKDTDPPEKFELYYPISPNRALLLVGPSSESLPPNSSISETFAHLYNLRMAAHSYRQVFSNCRQTLESLRDELPAYLSCFH